MSGLDRLKRVVRGWLRSWRTVPALIEEDASTLMRKFGEEAYRVARDRALAERLGIAIDADRTVGHWDQVRAEIGRRTGRDVTDTETRYERE